VDNLDKEIKKLRNLRQNKEKSNEELEVMAKEQSEQTEILDSLTFCLPEEKDFALNLLKKYLSESSIVSFSERDTLKHLIDLEILLERVKKFINNEQAKANPTIPLQFLSQVTELTNQIIEIKERLGLSQKEEQRNILEEWTKLKEKALAYYKENSGCNVVRCPECKKLFMILKDVRNYTSEKITFFKKTMLYNKEMYSWLDQGIITKEQLAKALGVSIDYVILIYENIYKNESKESIIDDK
jgi:hypothetical protein